MSTEAIDREFEVLTPDEHYSRAMECLEVSALADDGSTHRMNIILTALTHALLGGLRDGLDYTARNPVPGPGAERVPSRPAFEEDDDRP